MWIKWARPSGGDAEIENDPVCLLQHCSTGFWHCTAYSSVWCFIYLCMFHDHRPLGDYFSPFPHDKKQLPHLKYSHFSTILSHPWLKKVLWSFFSSPPPPALHMASIGQHAEAAGTLLQLGLEDSEDAMGATAQRHAKKADVVKVFQPDRPDDAWVHRTRFSPAFRSLKWLCM